MSELQVTDGNDFMAAMLCEQNPSDNSLTRNEGLILLNGLLRGGFSNEGIRLILRLDMPSRNEVVMSPKLSPVRITGENSDFNASALRILIKRGIWEHQFVAFKLLFDISCRQEEMSNLDVHEYLKGRASDFLAS